jgi:hypothetical protein
MKTFPKRGEIATTLLLLSIGALIFGTTLGIKQYNGRKAEPLQSSAQSTCRYTSRGYLKDRQGNVIAITSESDDNLKTYLEYQFTSNTGQYYEGKAKYLNGVLNSTSIFDYNYDMGDGKGKFIDIPVSAVFKRDRDKYNLFGWECRDKTSVTSCDKPKYTGGDGKESVVVRTKCGAVNDYWFIVEPKDGVNVTPNPNQPTVTSSPIANNPTTPPSQPQPPSNQVCRALNAACREEYTEICAAGTRTCRKVGTCSGMGGGELCSWDTGSCCGPCTDPAGDNEATVGNCLLTPFPTTPPGPGQPQPTSQTTNNTSIAWSITNTADESHGILQIGIALYKNGQYQRDYLSYPGTINNTGDVLTGLDTNVDYKIEPRAKKQDGVTNVSTVVQEVTSCTNKDGSSANISADKKSCTLKPGGSIALLIKNPGQNNNPQQSLSGSVDVYPNHRAYSKVTLEVYKNGSSDIFFYKQAYNGAIKDTVDLNFLRNSQYVIKVILYGPDGIIGSKQYTNTQLSSNFNLFVQATGGTVVTPRPTATPTPDPNKAKITGTMRIGSGTLPSGWLAKVDLCRILNNNSWDCNNSSAQKISRDQSYQFGGLDAGRYGVRIYKSFWNSADTYLQSFGTGTTIDVDGCSNETDFVKCGLTVGNSGEVVKDFTINIYNINSATPTTSPNGPRFAPETADFNGNGTIGTEDFFGALNNFGKIVTLNGSPTRITALYMSYILSQMGKSTR